MLNSIISLPGTRAKVLNLNIISNSCNFSVQNGLDVRETHFLHRKPMFSASVQAQFGGFLWHDICSIHARRSTRMAVTI
jgi:hypothetical protein